MRLNFKLGGWLLTFSLVGAATIYMNGIIPNMAPGSPIEHKLSLAGGTATAVAWSSDGQKLATYGNYGQNIEVWTKDGRHIVSMSRSGFDIPYINDSIAFINDDHFILTPPDGTSPQNQSLALSVWDAGTGKVARNVVGSDPTAGWRSNFAYLFVVSTNKEYVATLTRVDQKVVVYRVQSWDQPVTLRLRDQDQLVVTSIAISPDGSHVALGDATGQVSVYDARSGSWLYSIQAYKQVPMTPIQSLAFNSDGTEIATGAGAGMAGSNNEAPVKVWSAKDKNLISAFEQTNLAPIRTLKWNPSGQYVGFSAIDNKVRLWNPISGEKRYMPLSDSGSMCQAFSPDGKELAFCDGGDVKIIKILD